MKFKSIMFFLFGVGVGFCGASYLFSRKNDEIVNERVNEKVNKAEEEMRVFYLNADVVEEKDPSEDVKDEEEPKGFSIVDDASAEDFAEAIIANTVLTESPEKPDIFDYAKASLSKDRVREKPVEKSIDPVDDPETVKDFKMRKVTVTEFEDLTYSYILQELTLYQDGYVTDYKDEVLFKFKEMYPDASIDDQDETGHIYVAADYNMTVYDVTVVAMNYKDIYPDEV